MATTYIKRDLSVSETIYKWTWSAWVKRGTINGSAQNLFKSRTDGNNWVQCYFSDGGDVDRLHLHSYKNGGDHYKYTTTQRFRDTNSWYHFVLNVDSSQSTAGDRVRIYVNGERITSFSTSTNNLTNGDSLIFNTSDSGTGHTIGSWNAGSYFTGSMSHIHYSSGYSYAPTVFGSTDSATGEWEINTSPSFTLGGNGYTVLKNGNTITDQSSNSNDFTLGAGTLTKTEDCPSNVFATLSPLYKNTTNDTILANGNTDGSCRDNTKAGTYTTLGMPSGKFYCEVKIREFQNAGEAVVGVTGRPQGDVHQNKNVGDTTQSAAYRTNGQSEINATTASYGNSYDAGDIIGIAIDVDNSKLYFSKNGTWQNSGDPTSGSTGTGALSMPVAASACEEGAYFFGFGSTSTASSSAHKFSFNFGNGFFASTAVSSAGTNASNNGIFEYDVPTGYTALSTKGLNL